MTWRLDKVCSTLLLAGLLTGSLAGSADAQRRNLALHARYEWSVAPSYAACTDSSDATQLTDGKRVRDAPGFGNNEMVGWTLGAGSRLQLTFDLGALARIEEIVLSTRLAAHAGVLPPSVVAATSIDGETFVWAAAHDSQPSRHPPRTGSH
jgi:hypothetical protein